MPGGSMGETATVSPTTYEYDDEEYAMCSSATTIHPQPNGHQGTYHTSVPVLAKYPESKREVHQTTPSQEYT